MTVELEVKCDKCNCDIDSGDDSYCEDCYKELQDEIAMLEERVSDLENQLEGLQ